jgi:hypothetical protein
MDYGFWSTFRNTMLLWIVLSYDIMCQYSIHFWERMSANWGDTNWRVIRELVGITWLIPKFHLPAHIKRCWEEYNFSFARWTGRSDGEGVERGWAALNALARALREMGPGLWKDTLENHIGDMNWKKITGFRWCFCSTLGIPPHTHIARLLLTRITEAIPANQKFHTELADFEAMIDPGTLRVWREDVEAWEIDQSGYEKKHKKSPYHPRVKRECGIVRFLSSCRTAPSQNAVHLALAQEEELTFSKRIGTVKSDVTPTAMIAMGLELEELQCRIFWFAFLIFNTL